MNDQLENKPQIEERKERPIVLDLPGNRRREISHMIAGGRKFAVVVPQGTIDQFLDALDELYQDEEEGIPSYAEYLGKEVPVLKIVGRSSTDFEQRLSEFRDRKKAERLNSPWDYADNVHELNVWVNPDYLPIYGDAATTFVTIAKYAQNLYLFDHEIQFGRLNPQLKRALGGESDYTLTIGQKK